MNKIEQIIRHPLYQASMRKIEELEKERIFCRHGVSHSLDVARMAYIRCLEEKMAFSKEMIYAAALLHDIGRWQQYTEGTSHEEASQQIAAAILKDTDFDEEERQCILNSIVCHRSRAAADADPFAALLYDADKKTRLCFACQASGECYWPKEQKNQTIIC